MKNLYYLHFSRSIPANTIAHIADDNAVYHLNGSALHKAARSHVVQPFMLEIGTHVPEGLVIKDIRIGVNSQFAARTSRPVIAKSTLEFKMDLLSPTEQMTIEVHNPTPEEQLFLGIVYVRPL